VARVHISTASISSRLCRPSPAALWRKDNPQRIGTTVDKWTRVYAVVHSFSPLDQERDFSNTMIGQYKLDGNGHQGSMPTLCIVDANNLVAPTVGIRDLCWSKGLRVEDEHFLFLFRRKHEWVSSWDSMISKCCQSRDSATDESKYEDLDNDEDSNSDEVGTDGGDDEEEDSGEADALEDKEDEG
jgi:hypothetical protein